MSTLANDWAGRGRCARDDHTWEYEPARDANGNTYGPYRVCTTCWIGTDLADPSADHPEAAPAPLAPEHLRVLAELDLSL